MKQAKRTTDVRQAWLLGALAVGLIFLFSFVVLPYVDPGKKQGLAAPDFVLPVIHGGKPGNRLRLSDLRGSVVVLDFWASWCGPCKEQMPILDQVAAGYRDEEVMFVGVNTDAEQAHALRFLEQHPVSYISVYDQAGATSQDFGVTKLPTLVVIDAAGKIVYSEARVLGKRSLNELVDAALKQSG